MFHPVLNLTLACSITLGALSAAEQRPPPGRTPTAGIAQQAAESYMRAQGWILMTIDFNATGTRPSLTVWTSDGRQFETTDVWMLQLTPGMVERWCKERFSGGISDLVDDSGRAVSLFSCQWRSVHSR